MSMYVHVYMDMNMDMDMDMDMDMGVILRSGCGSKGSETNVEGFQMSRVSNLSHSKSESGAPRRL